MISALDDFFFLWINFHIINVHNRDIGNTLKVYQLTDETRAIFSIVFIEFVSQWSLSVSNQIAPLPPPPNPTLTT